MVNQTFNSSNLSEFYLAVAKDAISYGDILHAHDICDRLVTSDPSNATAWYLKAITAELTEERVDALNHALALDPTEADIRAAIYENARQLLEQDKFIAYLDETGDYYWVSTRSGIKFAYPKGHAAPDLFPYPWQRIIRWLGWSIVGLLPAGIGTLVCGPMAIVSAVRFLAQPSNRLNRRRVWIALFLAAVLTLLACFLTAILIIHFQ
jgi:hypothetical protein